MRIGILGGTFNPVHTGHVSMAYFALREFDLDNVYFMVTSDPPHKRVDDDISFEHRFNMAKIAAAEAEGVEASDIEGVRGGISYTVETLWRLKNESEENVTLFLIVGADMLFDMVNWKNPKRIFDLATIIVVRRDCSNYKLNDEIKKLKQLYPSCNVDIAEFSVPRISSTEVRNAVKNAKSIAYLVSIPVMEYIYSNGLYVDDYIRNILFDLKDRLTHKRFLHSISTMNEAMRLADRYGTDTKKARLAGLLHDCAKISTTDYLSECEEHGITIDDYERHTPGLLHPKLGAYYAKTRYGVQDQDILNAIAYHTLCREGMSDLEKIVYLADKIEPKRTYPGVFAIRKAARKSLNNGVLAAMDFSINCVLIAKKTLHPAITVAREYILKKI
ncbi:MAG: nicotinate-nucleotide adenylyltransferase [Clostridia bacterium]